MKKQNLKKIKNSKGISLIALTITILVLAIVTSIVVYNAKNSVMIRKYKKLENDISLLTDKVEMYYLKNERLPICFNSDNIPILYDGSQWQDGENANFKNNKAKNDNDNYYILDLDQIDGLSLNYGIDFFTLNSDYSNKDSISDIYVINEQSHKIYYVQGIQVDGKTYYTIGDDVEISLYKSIIYIRSKEDLEEIRTNVNQGIQSYKGYVLLQKNDIDLEGNSTQQWEPIGSEIYPFEGEYNGSGYVIKNLYIDTTLGNQGLFGINKGTIQNLGIESGTMKSNGNSGVIVAQNDGGTIINCYNKINATYNITNGELVTSAGICGSSNGGRISQCYNSGNISANFQRKSSGVCGIVGIVYNTTIEECYNSGDIIGTTQYQLPDVSQDGNNRASGIANEIDVNSSIINCYNTGNIKLISQIENDKNPVVAGILGQNQGGNIENCYNIGNIIIEETEKDSKTNRRAAICGCNYKSGSEENYINCYYLDGTATLAVGSNGYDGKNGYAPIVGNVKLPSELKKMAEALGRAYKQDEKIINKGYPILNWQ